MKTKAKKLKLNKMKVAALSKKELSTINAGNGDRSFTGNPIFCVVRHVLDVE